MLKYEKENNGFTTLLNYANKLYYANEIFEKKFTLVYIGKIIYAKYVTMYETENGLELDDPAYEEYNAIAFENIETGELFEVNYLNLPKEVYCGDERIL